MEGLHYLCERHYIRSSTVYYNIHLVMQCGYHDQLAHRCRMDQVLDYFIRHATQIRVLHAYLRSQLSHYMLGLMLQTLLGRGVACYPGLCHYMVVFAASSHNGQEASRPIDSSLPCTMKMGNNPRSFERGSGARHIVRYFRSATKAGAGQLLPPVARQPRVQHPVKKRYRQSFQGALREATGDYQGQKRAFEPGFFAALAPEVHEDFDKVWRERSMEQGWSELPAPTAIEETIYYPELKRMKND